MVFSNKLVHIGCNCIIGSIINNEKVEIPSPCFVVLK